MLLPAMSGLRPRWPLVTAAVGAAGLWLATDSAPPDPGLHTGGIGDTRRAAAPPAPVRSSLSVLPAAGAPTRSVREAPESAEAAGLRHALASSDARVHMVALAMLVNVPGVAAEIALSDAALHHASAGVREAAVHALGERDSNSALPVLQLALLDPEAAPRAASVAALVHLATTHATSPARVAYTLHAGLWNEDPVARLRTVDALGELGGPAAREVLASALRDPDDRVRAAAGEWLAGAD